MCVRARPPWIISRPGQGPVYHSLYLANLSTEPVPGLWIERKRKGSWSAQTSRASAVAAVAQLALPTLWSHTPGPLAGSYPLRMDPGPREWQQFEPIWDYRLDSINPALRPSYGSMTNLSIFLLIGASCYFRLLVAKILSWQSVMWIDWVHGAPGYPVMKLKRKTYRETPPREKWNGIFQRVQHCWLCRRNHETRGQFVYVLTVKLVYFIYNCRFFFHSSTL